MPKSRRNEMCSIAAPDCLSNHSTEVVVSPPRPLGINKMLVMAHKLQLQLKESATVAVCKKRGDARRFLHITFFCKLKEKVARRRVREALASMSMRTKRQHRAKQLRPGHRLPKVLAAARTG